MGKTKAPKGKTDTEQSAKIKTLKLATASLSSFYLHILLCLCFSKVGVSSQWSDNI